MEQALALPQMMPKHPQCNLLMRWLIRSNWPQQPGGMAAPDPHGGGTGCTGARACSGRP